ncbi:hypothetical protein [Candidatus Lariskella endosymbiont of Epinotia ramella]|uniref:hypothetical protein n=1 Tax=Candidatus Lariskella endosymbiont of Epinotia ramella TaxID=3066224 RepID=UPI0030D0DD0F
MLESIANYSHVKNGVMEKCYAKLFDILNDTELFAKILHLKEIEDVNIVNQWKEYITCFANLQIEELESYYYTMQYGITRGFINTSYSSAEIALLFKFFQALNQSKRALEDGSIVPKDTIEFFNTIFAGLFLSTLQEEILTPNLQVLRCFDCVAVKSIYIGILETLAVIMRSKDASYEVLNHYFSKLVFDTQRIEKLLKQRTLNHHSNRYNKAELDLLSIISKIVERYLVLSRNATKQEELSFIVSAIEKVYDKRFEITSIVLPMEEEHAYQDSMDYITHNLEVMLEVMHGFAAHLNTKAINKQILDLLLKVREITISKEISTSMQEKILYIIESYKELFCQRIANQVLLDHHSDLNINRVRVDLNRGIEFTLQLSLEEYIRSITRLNKFVITCPHNLHNELNVDAILKVLQTQLEKRLANNAELSVLEICDAILYLCEFSDEMTEKERIYYNIPQFLGDLILKCTEALNIMNNLGHILYLFCTLKRLDRAISSEERLINKLRTLYNNIAYKKKSKVNNLDGSIIALNEAIFYLDRLLFSIHAEYLDDLKQLLAMLKQKHSELVVQCSTSASDIFASLERCSPHEIGFTLQRCASAAVANEGLQPTYFDEEMLITTLPPMLINKIVIAESLIGEFALPECKDFIILLERLTKRCNFIAYNIKSVPVDMQELPIVRLIKEMSTS